MEENKDIITEYIALKKRVKEDTEKILAIEVMIFDDKENYEKDERITLVNPRETIDITDGGYERLQFAEVEIDVTKQVTTRKKLKDFDIDVQTLILQNPENYTKKYSKPSIRVK